jgi:hypothetical protein
MISDESPAEKPTIGDTVEPEDNKLAPTSKTEVLAFKDL